MGGRPALRSEDAQARRAVSRSAPAEVDISKFEDAFAKYGGKGSLTTVSYDLGDDPSAVADEAQRQAPQLIAKVKDSGATSVVLFTDIVNTTPAVMKAATAQEYFPEWVITGARIPGHRLRRPCRSGRPTRPRTCSASGPRRRTPPTGAAPTACESFFQSYWGETQGTYAPVASGIGFLLFSGIQLAGPNLTPQTFEQGVFSMPAAGGAIDGQISNFMIGYGRSRPGFPTTSTRRSGSTTR